ncbi:MAG: ATP-binding protein [Candidatus Geothermarchaeales archaeon]
MSRVGVILEGSTPRGFRMKIDRETSVPLHDYVVVEVEEPLGGTVRVLGEVVGLHEKDPLAAENLAIGESSAYGYGVARVEVLGYLENGVIYRPKMAPKPNTPVYKAGDEILQEFFRGREERIPVYVGSLVSRPTVKTPIHIQDLQFHLGIFAQTRGGKSYLAGKIIEEILTKTPFPVAVIDIHGDYVMMDRDADSDERHGDYDVEVYYPKEELRIPGVTAQEKVLAQSPRDVGYEVLEELLRGLGGRQKSILNNTYKSLLRRGKPFGLADIIQEIRVKEDAKESSKDRDRITGIRLRLERLARYVDFSPTGTRVTDLLKPHTLTVICLRGLSASVQDVYAGLIVDMIYRNQIMNAEDLDKAPPTFLFIEEAHRVASKEGRSSYAVEKVSTAIREGAKFKLYLILISQRPRSIDPDALSNIGNYAVLRVVNRQDQSIIESASESFTSRLVEDLPSLNQGEAVLTGPFVPLPAQVRTLKRRSKHHGVTPNLYAIMQDMLKKRGRVVEKGW